MEFSWTRDNAQALIELYEQHECLYNVRCKSYINRDIKAAALNSILEVMRQRCPTISLDVIKKKFKGLRSQFASELKILQSRRKSGMGVEEEYVPKLWCFKQLSFLKTFLKMRESVSNTDGMTDSFIEDSSESETPIKKKPNKRTFEDGLNELQVVLEKKRERKCTYDWLGKKVVSVLQEIETDEKPKVVWEIEGVLNKYWQKSYNKKEVGNSSEILSQASTSKLSAYILSSTTTSPTDILQLSMEGIFEDENDLF